LIGNNNNTARYDVFNNNNNISKIFDNSNNNKLFSDNINNKMINMNMDNLSPKNSNKKSKIFGRYTNLVMNTYEDNNN
jgi:hypothetical protein